MSSTLLEIGPALAVTLVMLAAAAAVVVAVAGLGRAREMLVAMVRATVQLGAVSLVIAAVVGSLWWTGLFLVGMATIATYTAGGRVAACRRWPAALAILLGTVPALGLLLAAGVLPLKGLAVVPVAGIFTGGAMVATSLAGRRMLDELTTRRGETDAALALGFSMRDARLLIGRDAAAQALTPVMDQTRTVGLVTLPGAFVGMLLGGASPVEAGAVQLMVLVALLAVEGVAVVVVIELVARGVLETPR